MRRQHDDDDGDDALAYALLGFDPNDDFEDEDDDEPRPAPEGFSAPPPDGRRGLRSTMTGIDEDDAPFGIGTQLTCLRPDADVPLFGLPPVNGPDATIIKFPNDGARKHRLTNG